MKKQGRQRLALVFSSEGRVSMRNPSIWNFF
jgi:hypothetical protein